MRSKYARLNDVRETRPGNVLGALKEKGSLVKAPSGWDIAATALFDTLFSSENLENLYGLPLLEYQFRRPQGTVVSVSRQEAGGTDGKSRDRFTYLPMA